MKSGFRHNGLLATLMAGAVLAAVTVAGPVKASDNGRWFPGDCRALPPVVAGAAASLHPEGVAYDPTRCAFLVGSLRHGTVSVVRRDGSVRMLASDPQMVSTIGVHVDAARNRLLVVYADLGVGERSTPATTMALSGVGFFDLRTGRLQRLVDLAAVAGPGLHAANDLTIAPDGTAYVTDPLSDALLRIDVDGHASVLIRDPRFHDAATPTSFGLNGIVWHPRGYLLAVKSWGGELFRVSTGSRPKVQLVSTDQPIHNGDGLLLRPDGTLLAVTNPLGPQGISAVRLLHSRDQWASAQTTRLLPWADPAPTTAAATPFGDYVLDGRLDVLFGGSSLSDNFDLRRVNPSNGN
jgi:sugar lactone lactonase YvrE